MAANWCQAACGLAEIQAEFMHRLDEALKSGVGCSFTMGSGLTHSGKPYLAHCFRGEFFAFELTPAQATKLGLGEDYLVCCQSRQQQDHVAKPAPIVHLDEVVVHGAATLDWSTPIAGEFTYGSKEIIVQPLVLRAVCEPLGSGAVTLFHHFHDVIPSSRTSSFSLAALGAAPTQLPSPYAGPLAVFFQLWTKNGPVRPVVTIVQPNAGKPPPLPGFESWKPPLMTPWLLPPTATPPSWDPPSPSAPAVPISDIRAVLVEVV